MYSYICKVLDVDKDTFQPQKKDEELFSRKPYFSATGTLKYLC